MKNLSAKERLFAKIVKTYAPDANTLAYEDDDGEDIVAARYKPGSVSQADICKMFDELREYGFNEIKQISKGGFDFVYSHERSDNGTD